MKDSATVISVKQDLALVEVSCFAGCEGCAAKNLCKGKDQKRGLLTVKNPLGASPGDSVAIEIPESQYSRALIRIFGILLILSLAGMAAGYFASSFLPLASSEASLIGLALGLLAGGAWLLLYFRTKNWDNLYPMIIDIISKGGYHG